MTEYTVTRNSVLNVRHKALGAKLDGDTWNGMAQYLMLMKWAYSIGL